MSRADGRGSSSRLSDFEFRIFADLMRRRAGLHFEEDMRFLLEKRVGRRLDELGLDGFSSYLHLLRSGPDAEDEMDELTDRLTTNETYFFRESSQLESLVEEIIPEMLGRSDRRNEPVTVWSAGCSSGEEPFSVVMLAREAGLEVGRDFRLVASDVSRAVLAKARRGVYREAAFRETPESLRRRYFVEKEGVSRLSDEVRLAVDFVHLNLLDEVKLRLLDRVDVVLCRNVIMYFDAENKRRAVSQFHHRLEPGGYLLLGRSESLINVTADFELKHLSRDLVYRRPVSGDEREDPWRALARDDDDADGRTRG